MNILATIMEDDTIPRVTLRNAITYNGHTMHIHLFEDPTGFDVSWTVETVDSRTIEGGLYPVNFAEIEACQIISEQLENMPEAQGLAESAKAILEAVAIVKEAN